MTVKLYDSVVGTGRFRVTKYKGQLIGIEIWPDVKPGEPYSYLVKNFAYIPPWKARIMKFFRKF